MRNPMARLPRGLAFDTGPLGGGPLGALRGNARAKRARMPPSPSLSARRMKTRYLIVTVNVSAQNTSERTPSMFGGVGATA